MLLEKKREEKRVREKKRERDRDRDRDRQTEGEKEEEGERETERERKTCNTGLQYCCGQVDRGTQPPSTPQPQPPHRSI